MVEGKTKLSEKVKVCGLLTSLWYLMYIFNPSTRFPPSLVEDWVRMIAHLPQDWMSSSLREVICPWTLLVLDFLMGA